MSDPVAHGLPRAVSSHNSFEAQTAPQLVCGRMQPHSNAADLQIDTNVSISQMTCNDDDTMQNSSLPGTHFLTQNTYLPSSPASQLQTTSSCIRLVSSPPRTPSSMHAAYTEDGPPYPVVPAASSKVGLSPHDVTHETLEDTWQLAANVALDGNWYKTNGGPFVATIAGSIMYWQDGIETTLSKTGGALMMHLEGDCYTAQVRDGQIHWSDGDVWERRECRSEAKHQQKVTFVLQSPEAADDIQCSAKPDKEQSGTEQELRLAFEGALQQLREELVQVSLQLQAEQEQHRRQQEELLLDLAYYKDLAQQHACTNPELQDELCRRKEQMSEHVEQPFVVADLQTELTEVRDRANMLAKSRDELESLLLKKDQDYKALEKASDELLVHCKCQQQSNSQAGIEVSCVQSYASFRLEVQTELKQALDQVMMLENSKEELESMLRKKVQECQDLQRALDELQTLLKKSLQLSTTDAEYQDLKAKLVDYTVDEFADFQIKLNAEREQAEVPEGTLTGYTASSQDKKVKDIESLPSSGDANCVHLQQVAEDLRAQLDCKERDYQCLQRASEESHSLLQKINEEFHMQLGNKDSEIHELREMLEQRASKEHDVVCMESRAQGAQSLENKSRVMVSRSSTTDWHGLKASTNQQDYSPQAGIVAPDTAPAIASAFSSSAPAIAAPAFAPATAPAVAPAVSPTTAPAIAPATAPASDEHMLGNAAREFCSGSSSQRSLIKPNLDAPSPPNAATASQTQMHGDRQDDDSGLQGSLMKPNLDASFPPNTKREPRSQIYQERKDANIAIPSLPSATQASQIPTIQALPVPLPSTVPNVQALPHPEQVLPNVAQDAKASPNPGALTPSERSLVSAAVESPCQTDQAKENDAPPAAFHDPVWGRLEMLMSQIPGPAV